MQDKGNNGNYYLSKLSNILFAKELQNRVPAGVKVITICPGYVATNITAIGPLYLKIFGLIGRFFAKSPEQGAFTTIHAVIDDNVENGAHYADCQKKNVSNSAGDLENAKAMWELSEQALALKK
ncbi:retinol dehydrogenase [Acrasis kona]|uniref:Retinol dehydrogenase n=1 Tax=Acrasis kona TaxID=1008807 RepID=A0AAW2ZR17_9EUKA